MLPLEPIVAMFDTKTVALRAIAELRAAAMDDIWLAVVRGENDAGQTTVGGDSEDDIALHAALAARGTPATSASRYDGILPPGTAVISLRVFAKADQAVRIIELSGGHIEH